VISFFRNSFQFVGSSSTANRANGLKPMYLVISFFRVIKTRKSQGQIGTDDKIIKTSVGTGLVVCLLEAREGPLRSGET
jgi:hypothetical protein